MSKKRRSVSLSEENDEYLSNHPNASQLIDELVTQYRSGGMADQTVRQFRIQQLETEVDEHKSEAEWAEKKAELKRQELQELKQEAQSVEQQTKAELSEAREDLAQTPRDASNPAIQNWADKLGMTPEELIDELDGGDE